MSQTYEKARTSAQGAYLAEQVSRNFSRIFVLLALSGAILALFIPTSFYFSHKLITDENPTICNPYTEEIRKKILAIEDEIKGYEQQVIAAKKTTNSDTNPQNPSSELSADDILNEIYNSKEFKSKVESISSQYKNNIEGDIVPTRPNYL